MSGNETTDMKKRIALGLAYIQKLEGSSDAELVERMRGAKEKFLAEIDGLSDAQVVFSPGKDQWCVSQVCLHMQDALGVVNDGVRDLVKGIATRDTTGEEVMGQLADDPGDFALTEQALGAAFNDSVEVIDNLPDEPNLDIQAPHPFFGMLNCRQWITFNIMHTGAHIRQIQRIKGAPDFPG